MLHKTSRLKGFHLHASDGEIGHVDDFLVDPAWKVAYLVVDTSNWVGGKSVLVSPTAITCKIAPTARPRYSKWARAGRLPTAPTIPTSIYAGPRAGILTKMARRISVVPDPWFMKSSRVP